MRDIDQVDKRTSLALLLLLIFDRHYKHKRRHLELSINILIYDLFQNKAAIIYA
jgi:hypothetical protein